MQTRIYNGPHPEVEIPREHVLEDGTTAIIAVRGEPTLLPDELAAQLDEQGDTWLREDAGKSEKDAAAPAKQTAADLRARAEEAGIEVPKGAKKAEVEQLLEEHMQSLITDGNAGDGETTQGATADAQAPETGDSSGSSDTAAGGDKE